MKWVYQHSLLINPKLFSLRKKKKTKNKSYATSIHIFYFLIHFFMKILITYLSPNKKLFEENEKEKNEGPRISSLFLPCFSLFQPLSSLPLFPSQFCLYD